MAEKVYDLLIVGGGPAGLAAAIAAKENGIDNLLILERDTSLGGILNQCIHNGFGLHTFREELTGPEYAARFINKAIELDIPYELESMVMDISVDMMDKKLKVVAAFSREYGLQFLKTKTVILAMGCRERPRGALNIAGYRPAGIFSAGTAQKLVNLDGYMPGKEVVILGSGDIGLIMARRLTLEGARVKLVAEIMPYSGGLKRNIVQCLDDFEIPLRLNCTVVKIDGAKRVKGVVVASVDENRKPIKGTEEYIECDTLLLSVGLIPENELTRRLGIEMDKKTMGPVVSDGLMTSMSGVFACGNVLHVHGLVDNVSREADIAGKSAAAYIKGEEFVLETAFSTEEKAPLTHKDMAQIQKDGVNITEITCIKCPNGCQLRVEHKDKEILGISGNKCPRGEEHARGEIVNPTRMVTSSVMVSGSARPVVSVKTKMPIPKDKVDECARLLKNVCVTAPVRMGDEIISNVAGSGVSVIATSEAL